MIAIRRLHCLLALGSFGARLIVAKRASVFGGRPSPSSFVSTQPSNSPEGGTVKDGPSTNRSLPPGRHKAVSRKDAITCDETETLLSTPDCTDSPTSRQLDRNSRVPQFDSGGGEGGGYFPVPPIQLFGGREERRPMEAIRRVAGSAPTRFKTRRLRNPSEGRPLAEFPLSHSDRKDVTVAPSSPEVALTKPLSTASHFQPLQQPRPPSTSSLRVSGGEDEGRDASRTQPRHIASEEEDADDDEEYDSTLSPSTSSSIQPHCSSLRVTAPTDSPGFFSVTPYELRHNPTSPDPVPTPSSSFSWSALQPDRDSQDNLVLEAPSVGCGGGSVYPSFNMAASMSLSPVDSAPLAPSGEQSTNETPSGEYSTPSGEDYTLRVGLEQEETTSTTTNKDISHSSSSAPATTELLDNIINNNNGH